MRKTRNTDVREGRNFRVLPDEKTVGSVGEDVVLVIENVERVELETTNDERDDAELSAGGELTELSGGTTSSTVLLEVVVPGGTTTEVLVVVGVGVGVGDCEVVEVVVGTGVAPGVDAGAVVVLVELYVIVPSPSSVPEKVWPSTLSSCVVTTVLPCSVSEN